MPKREQSMSISLQFYRSGLSGVESCSPAFLFRLRLSNTSFCKYLTNDVNITRMLRFALGFALTVTTVRKCFLKKCVVETIGFAQLAEAFFKHAPWNIYIPILAITNKNVKASFVIYRFDKAVGGIRAINISADFDVSLNPVLGLVPIHVIISLLTQSAVAA